jgi:hypothetical protein
MGTPAARDFQAVRNAPIGEHFDAIERERGACAIAHEPLAARVVTRCDAHRAVHIEAVACGGEAPLLSVCSCLCALDKEEPQRSDLRVTKVRLGACATGAASVLAEKDRLAKELPALDLSKVEAIPELGVAVAWSAEEVTRFTDVSPIDVRAARSAGNAAGCGV